MAKKAMAKGLGSVFGESIDDVLNEIANGSSKEGSINLNIDTIRPNPYQPRKEFDQEALEELSNSIKEHGVFQPILVRKATEGYELIAGERRLRASKLAGLKEIPAIIKEFDDQSMMEISILENIQREDLSVVEEAKAYEQLIKKLKYTQDKLATRLGKSRTYVTNILRILKLPQEIIELLSNGKLTYGHARALINIEDENKQIEIAKKVESEGLSVRDIEKLANEAKPVEKVKTEKKKDPYLENVRKSLEGKLLTSVKVTAHNITIDYKNTADLNRILEALDCLD